jgi:hypothetical protein
MAKATTASLYGAVEITPESSGRWNKTRSAAGITVCMHRGDARATRTWGLTLHENSREEQASGEVPKSNWGFVVERLFDCGNEKRSAHQPTSLRGGSTTE